MDLYISHGTHGLRGTPVGKHCAIHVRATLYAIVVTCAPKRMDRIISVIVRTAVSGMIDRQPCATRTTNQINETLINTVAVVHVGTSVRAKTVSRNFFREGSKTCIRRIRIKFLYFRFSLNWMNGKNMQFNKHPSVSHKY
ncbi:uncharacterized protein LOC112682170 [Sipha flava]|uniref:Uncharacterized protein LOC112682170 n=1 Tax=Sipha flava TaxID=143950 RepID=A0A8B8FDP3_9HEMI|nr:uncharacterized protein LOC112682170 [Sipha flava]